MEKSKNCLKDYDEIIKNLQIIYVLSDWMQDKVNDVELCEIDHLCEDIEERIKDIRQIIDASYEPACR